jgi:hypothetical protein
MGTYSSLNHSRQNLEIAQLVCGKQVWQIHTVKYYLAIKRNYISCHVNKSQRHKYTWSEKSQTKKKKTLLCDSI